MLPQAGLWASSKAAGLVGQVGEVPGRCQTGAEIGRYPGSRDTVGAGPGGHLASAGDPEGARLGGCQNDARPKWGLGTCWVLEWEGH